MVIPGLPQVGGMELLIVLFIILLFFGSARIPSLARSLGSGLSEFRKGVSGRDDEAEESEKEELPGETEERVAAGQKR